MNKKTQKLQLIYILPNLFTATSAFLGVISILASVKGDFDKAVYYIIISLIFDGLDGRIARFTNTMSKFGAEFDSLADIIAFGVAPSILFYYSIGIEFNKLGSLVAAMYVVFGAIRLARFNVTNAHNEPSVFIGLPIPTAAVAISMWVMMYQKYQILQNFEIFILFAHAILGILMVSNVRYPSFKKLNFQKSNVIKILIYLIILFSFIYLYTIESVTFLVSVYLFYGIIRAFYTLIVAKWKKNKYNT